MVVTVFSGRSNPLRQLFTGQPKGGSTTSVTALTPRSRACASSGLRSTPREAHYCLQWRIANALVHGRSEVIAVLARELPLLAGKAIDLVEVRGDTNVLLLALIKTSR